MDPKTRVSVAVHGQDFVILAWVVRREALHAVAHKKRSCLCGNHHLLLYGYTIMLQMLVQNCH